MLQTAATANQTEGPVTQPTGTVTQTKGTATQTKGKPNQIRGSLSCAQVGVDVPEASVIIVEHSERFGLAQLHQLRGRVGRGKRASTCYLMTPHKTALTRLQVLTRSQNGFTIAEADLQER